MDAASILGIERGAAPAGGARKSKEAAPAKPKGVSREARACSTHASRTARSGFSLTRVLSLPLLSARSLPRRLSGRAGVADHAGLQHGRAAAAAADPHRGLQREAQRAVHAQGKSAACLPAAATRCAACVLRGCACVRVGAVRARRGGQGAYAYVFRFGRCVPCVFPLPLAQVRWEWKPFTSSARTDGLPLMHWVKARAQAVLRRRWLLLACERVRRRSVVSSSC
jgi:hypothetical protein